MTNSREKGARAELKARDLLRQYTGLQWERTPGSGALDARHGLKGDLYIPNSSQVYCVEVKHYEADHLTSKILTDKEPQLITWWRQALRQGAQVGRKPMLLFKFDRSKWFVALKAEDTNNATRRVVLAVDDMSLHISELEAFLKSTEVKWTV